MSIFEQIAGCIGFLDSRLNRVSAKDLPIWEGIFRVSPPEVAFKLLEEELQSIHTHEEMRSALKELDPHVAIHCASRLIKSLLQKLDKPLLPMSFALDKFENDKDSDKGVMAAALTDEFLHAIAKHQDQNSMALYATTGAQLLALLCQVSRSSFTKMNEYNLIVCLLPSVCGSRQQVLKTEELLAEQKAFMTFQSNHRANLVSKLEGLITYGRRIWGAILTNIQNGHFQQELEALSKLQKPRRSIPVVTRLYEKVRRKSGTADGAPHRPSLVTRAESQGFPLLDSPGIVEATSSSSSFLNIEELQVSEGISNVPKPPQRRISADLNRLSQRRLSVERIKQRSLERHAKFAEDEVGGVPLPPPPPPVIERTPSIGSTTQQALLNSAAKRRLSRESSGNSGVVLKLQHQKVPPPHPYRQSPPPLSTLPPSSNGSTTFTVGVTPKIPANVLERSSSNFYPSVPQRQSSSVTVSKASPALPRPNNQQGPKNSEHSGISDTSESDIL